MKRICGNHRTSTKIRRIELGRLLEHPDNPNWMSRAAFGKLVRNIERTGRYEPLVVRPHPKKHGFFQILNGPCRCKALRQLGHRTAEVVVWHVDDEQSALLLTTLNRLRGRDELDKKLSLLRRLRQHMPIHDMARLLPQTRGQLTRLLAYKPMSVPKPHTTEPPMVPLVFFVDQTQRRAIEEALSLAAPVGTGARASKRSAGLARIAERFLTRLPAGVAPKNEPTGLA
jgi:ParB-like chromosome segregation protein Spo0J